VSKEAAKTLFLEIDLSTQILQLKPKTRAFGWGLILPIVDQNS